MAHQKRVLVTGFEPFGGQRINPSWICVSSLPDQLDGCKIIKEELPVVWFDAAERLFDLIEEHRPHIVMCVGQGAGTPNIHIERVGVNLCNGTDNEGLLLEDAPSFAGGPNAYFSTFPYKSMLKSLKEEKVPAEYSFSAGTYLCNHVLYSALHKGATGRPGMKAGFVHVPLLPEQVQQSGGWSMPLNVMEKGVLLCAKALCESLA